VLDHRVEWISTLLFNRPPQPLVTIDHNTCGSAHAYPSTRRIQSENAVAGAPRGVYRSFEARQCTGTLVPTQFSDHPPQINTHRHAECKTLNPHTHNDHRTCTTCTTCKHARTRTRTHSHTAHTHTHTHARAHTHAHTHIYTHTHTHICTHAH
jgi:hypothetical protein